MSEWIPIQFVPLEWAAIHLHQIFKGWTCLPPKWLHLSQHSQSLRDWVHCFSCTLPLYILCILMFENVAQGWTVVNAFWKTKTCHGNVTWKIAGMSFGIWLWGFHYVLFHDGQPFSLIAQKTRLGAPGYNTSSYLARCWGLFTECLERHLMSISQWMLNINFGGLLHLKYISNWWICQIQLTDQGSTRNVNKTQKCKTA